MDLAIEPPAASPIGLVYEVRGKLGVGRKQGVCLAVEDDGLLVHFSPKDKEPGRLPRSAEPTDIVPADLGPASRLHFAADLENGKHSWDREALRDRAAELCRDVRVLRRLADDALRGGWQHMLDGVPLTESERAWRSAHHAATLGDMSTLRDALAKLPSAGYPTRWQLLLPHLGAIHREPDLWRPVLDAMAQSDAPDGEVVKAVIAGAWHEALDAAAALAPENRRSMWSKLRDQLLAGTTVSPPPFHDTPAWTAASLVSSRDGSRPIDAALAQLVGLEPALLDDLVDEGRITKAAALTSLRGGIRTYLMARLDPAKLSDADTQAMGNIGEFARRLFLSRDTATLSGLEAAPRAVHYQALLDVIEGARPDPERLDAETSALLELPTAVLGQIKDGATATLPSEVIADPSLWPMFADAAISGKLLPIAGRPADDPLNVWIGAHRLLGLIWEGDLEAAIEHGSLLAPHAGTVEEQHDEVLNLTAYALFQSGRVDDALDLLEHALQGAYTENLLVNASIVAGEARPEVGVQYLARLVDEAPTPELQRSGLDQAIRVWQQTDFEFPQVLVPALRTVLSAGQPIDEYLRLGTVAVNVAPDIVGTLPNPGGELDGPYRLIQVRRRWKTEEDMSLADLAGEYISLYGSVGRAEWFMADWRSWVGTIRDSVFVDFGEAAGSAQFIDRVLMEAPDLFTPEERSELAPQAGAHLASAFRKDNNWLNDAAFEKFIFRPLDEFLATREDFEPGRALNLANNFALCAGLTALHLLEVYRPQSADEYNALVERLRWDRDNFIAIQSQKERLLREALSGPIATIERVVQGLRRLGPLDDKRQALVNDVVNGLAEWRSECERLLASL